MGIEWDSGVANFPTFSYDPTMTVDELIAKLAKYPGPTRVNCLEVEGNEQAVYQIVNVHLDLTGVHLIVENWVKVTP